jgi:hypothetical protein
MDKRLPNLLHTVFNLVAMLGLAGSLAAAPVRMFSPVGSSGFWSNPNAWQPQGLPQTGEEIEIASGKSCQVDLPVIVNNPIRIQSGAFLTIGASFTLTSGADVSVIGTGKLLVQDSDLILTGNVLVSGSLSLSGNATLVIQNRNIALPILSGMGDYRLRFTGVNSIPAGSPPLEIPNLENNGDLQVGSSLKITQALSNNGNLTFGPGASLEVLGSFLQSVGSKFNLNNQSFPLKMHISGNQRWQNAGSFFSGSQAEITLNSIADPTFLNTGVAQMNSSVFIQSGSGVIRNTGTLSFTQQQGLWFSGNEDARIESPASIELFVLQLNKTGGSVRFLGPASLIVKDQISVLAGTLDLQGNPVVLKASSTFTGKITSVWGTLTGAGQVTQEQFIPGPSAGWYFLGPVGINQTIASFSDDFQTSGPFPGASIPASADRSTLFTFDGTSLPTGALSGEVLGWRIPVGGNLETGKGYRAYLRSDFFNGRRIVDFTGPLVQGDFDFPVSYNTQGYGGGGWNFLSNPYPCPIDWNADDWTLSNMGNALYIWNGEAKQYGVFLKGSDPSEGINGVGPVIPAGQAFFVKATASNPVLTVTEAAKTAENGSFLRSSGNTIPSVRLRVATADGTADESLIRFSDRSDARFNPLEDAEKWTSGSLVELANESPEGNKCAIQTLPIPTGFGQFQVPVLLKSTLPTKLTFTFRNRDQLPGTLYLMDARSGTYTLLSEESEFNLEPNPTGEKRYFLVIHTGTGISPEVLLDKKQTYLATYSGGKVQVKVQNPSPSLATYRLLDASGKELEVVQPDLSSSSNFQFGSHTKPGIYLVQKIENGFSQTLRLAVW